MGFRETGVIKVGELERLGLMPSRERLKKGPVVIAECPEEIPCNICVDACPFKAISMDKIYGIPRIDWDKCIGCGVCVAYCPGLALFVVDLSKYGDKAYVTLPHEFYPPPRKNMTVKLLSRDGRVLGAGRVVKVWSYNNTWVVTVEVPKEYAMEVRGIWVEE
ncbi:MAG: 4Fe-4S binding protein [Desulfurococcales archaeon]|nr:4Fe-4S binding protein [Desulfurococcales archaeon]